VVVDTQERQVGVRRPRLREWPRLATLKALGFGRREEIKAQYRIFGVFRWALLWATAMLEMALGMAWTDSCGQALVVLIPPGLLSRRSALAMVPIVTVVAAGVLLVWSVARPLALVLGAALLVAALDPPRFLRLRALPRSRELRKLRPHGSYCLQGLVRDPAARGAGRRLVESLCDLADRRGWVLSLDAGDGWLRDYYAELGFVPLGPPVAFPWGQSRTAMARFPNASDGGDRPS